jgi:hypothetical protein
MLLLLFLAIPASAQQDYPRDVSYCWTLPTEYVDGTPIQAGDLANTRIVVTRQSGETVIDGLVPIGINNPGDRQCFSFASGIPQPGTYTALAYAITVDDISSDASNEAIKKFTGKPKPATSLEATP